MSTRKNTYKFTIAIYLAFTAEIKQKKRFHHYGHGALQISPQSFYDSTSVIATYHSSLSNCTDSNRKSKEKFLRRTWIILHHDRGHAPVSGMVGVIPLAIGVPMHVGHVPLMLR